LQLWTFAFLFVLSTTAFGATSSEITAKTSELAQKRAYPGGLDEEDLKVQEQLPEAVRKIDRRSVTNQIFKDNSLAAPEPVEDQ
jgi:hypothetical protein